MMNEVDISQTDSHWKSLYKIGGIATIIMMILFLFDVISWILLRPYPASAQAWFTLLQENRLVGLLLLSFPTLFGMVFYYLTFLCLYNILRRENQAFVTLATLLAFIGITILIISHGTSYTVVSLSHQFMNTTQEAQRTSLIIATETSLASQATSLNLGGFFSEGAALIFSLLMLKSAVFGKTTAWLGIIGHGLDFIRISMILAFIPETVGAILLVIGGLPQLIWLVIVGIKLMKLGWSK